jgi:hypothetical protein
MKLTRETLVAVVFFRSQYNPKYGKAKATAPR